MATTLKGALELVTQSTRDLPDRLVFIADIAANHDGDLDRALSLIELAAEAGADIAKFQHFRAETIVSATGFAELGENASHQKSWRESVFETYRKYALPYEWTETLAARCAHAGIEFMSTPYDFKAVDLLAPLVQSFKIGSGDLNWHEFLGYVAELGKPMILATGASTWDEVASAVSVVQEHGAPLTVMQCNTNYTGDEGNDAFLNLRVLSEYRRRFPGCAIGLSDHTKGSATIQLAVALGATVFERHFTDDSTRPGPDHAFSLEPAEWRAMVDAALAAQRSLGSGVKVVEENEISARVVQRRAIRYASHLKPGTRLERKDLRVTRPCPNGAMDASQVEAILGSVLAVAVEEDSLADRSHFR